MLGGEIFSKVIRIIVSKAPRVYDFYASRMRIINNTLITISN